jgi:Uma2 family endonuclease
MSMPARHHRYSFKEYLLVEEMSTVKHEYLDGEIYAMAGGSILHAGLSATVGVMLSNQVRGRCRIYSSDLRVRVGATGLTSYPDSTMVCGSIEADPENKDTVANPTALVEVLSPSTIDYDLGEKFDHYRQIPSLKAVIYIWQDRRRVEVRERVGDVWRTTVAEDKATAVISALECHLDLVTLYNDAGATFA